MYLDRKSNISVGEVQKESSIIKLTFNKGNKVIEKGYSFYKVIEKCKKRAGGEVWVVATRETSMQLLQKYFFIEYLIFYHISLRSYHKMSK